jgi:DNA repair photolyase
MKPIYQPTGRAREYCDWALNIYSGCNHGCTYCFARKLFERYHPNEKFDDVKPRPGIVEATEKQLKSGKYAGKVIQLCFTCDPYPAEIDTTSTREIIKLIKAAGAHVQILTKGGDRARRDFDLLDSGDWFGITLTSSQDIAKQEEPFAARPAIRLINLFEASKKGINIWISIEPVLELDFILGFLRAPKKLNPLYKIGKLNHINNNTDWKLFGIEAERICRENGLNYYIKDDLRKDMESGGDRP